MSKRKEILEGTSQETKVEAIWKPRHRSLGIGTGIEIGIRTDINNAIISTSIRPMTPKRRRVVTQDEGITPAKSRGHLTWIMLHLHFLKAYGT